MNPPTDTYAIWVREAERVAPFLSSTVRTFDPATGEVDTFGEFNELGRRAAVTLAKLLASGDAP